LNDLDSWCTKLSGTIIDKLSSDNGQSGDIVDTTVFLDELAQELHKLEALFAEKSKFLLAYDVRRIQNIILVSFQFYHNPIISTNNNLYNRTGRVEQDKCSLTNDRLLL